MNPTKPRPAPSLTIKAAQPHACQLSISSSWGDHVRIRTLTSAALLAVGCLAAALGPAGPARAGNAVVLQVDEGNFGGVPIDGSSTSLDIDVRITAAVGPTAELVVGKVTLGISPVQPGMPANTAIEVQYEGPGGWSTVMNGMTGSVTVPLVNLATGQPARISDATDATIHLRVRESPPATRCLVNEILTFGFPGAQWLLGGAPGGSAQVSVMNHIVIGSSNYNVASPPPCASMLNPPPGPTATTRRPTATPAHQSSVMPSGTAGSAGTPSSPAASGSATDAASGAAVSGTDAGASAPGPAGSAASQDPSSAGLEAAPAGSSSGTSPLPWILTVVVLAAAAGGGAVALRRRGRNAAS